MRSIPRSRRIFLLICLVLVVPLAAGSFLWPVDEQPATAAPGITSRNVRIDVLDGPERQQRVQIDLRLYAPAETPAPAVVLAHGFGEDKSSMAAPARQLATRGFTVLTYSSRGFGHSTGKIALNSPAYEVTDARQILDWLARQPEVVSEDTDDPLVGVAGVSYGGALSLLLAGTDPRVDAIAPIMTYNDLTGALLPNSASSEPIPSATPGHGSFGDHGVFKETWAGLFFATGTRDSAPTEAFGNTGHSVADSRPSQGTAPPDSLPSDSAPSESAQPGIASSESAQPAPSSANPSSLPSPPASSSPASSPSASRAPQLGSAICGNFIAEVCAAYTELARTGTASQQTLGLLAAASPASVTDNIDVPTLLVQGQRDSLFGLAQADANARQIAAAGGEVKMIWYAGGHGGSGLAPSLWSRVGDWFAHYLHDPGAPEMPAPQAAFEYQVVAEQQPGEEATSRTVVASAYPGLQGQHTQRYSLPLHGAPTRVINPPGGRPTSTSSLPGTSMAPEAAEALDHRFATDIAGQVATFRTSPAEQQLLITGVPQTRLSVASVPGQASTGEAVLFAKLYDVGPDGHRELLGNGVAPLRITDLPADGTPVEVNVALPGMVHTLQAGHHLRLAVTTTDRAYTTPDTPAVHRIGLAGERAVSLPSVPGTSTTESAWPTAALTGMGAIVLMALLGWVAALVHRRVGTTIEAGLVDTPLAISGLGKSYRDKSTAVRDLSMRVERGQVVGLLGPNGAGKTTTLRMMLGLLRPSSGEVRVFGRRISPGSPVLARVGTFVEDPGLLPHLSGMNNLQSYWAATGRPEAHAHFEEVLHTVGLESAAEQPVSTYSHGMKQRLAIARAMLGLPDLLVLDEPTNGLDPPQIHRMREVLRRYASTGRAVLLSSHLLAEVEQTCTHVVVMHRGEHIAAGSIEEIVAHDGETTFRVDEPANAAATLRSLEGLGAVQADGNTVHAELGGHTAAVAVNALVAAGVSVNQVGPRRLEDAFLELLEEENR
ncbi:alpha/beta fold hydrolase [Haloactinomyces albus]|uniref:ABC-2 type transport system ATP-binding protein n=1 Tax=Haloactinomyces albus TaxID=1352928 RepID=A0AAE3ZBV7_9ACTN|nr:alpha/beta fold hydrolase [Haloactinomyces albus]MDR7300382.1 ABC-2 type transport system ATP-binding protein [Haloactinomyces albus]